MSHVFSSASFLQSESESLIVTWEGHWRNEPVWNAESARIVDFAIDFVIGFVIDFVMKIDFGIDFLAKIDFGIDF